MNIFILFLVVLFTGILLGGDYLIKAATISPEPIRLLFYAVLLYGVSVFGWYYILLDQKIAVIGMLFAMLSLIGTTLIGIFGFGEKLEIKEIIGLILAMISIVLLVNKA